MPLYVISGGPGAGKTTLLTALQQVGFGTADEVSRQLIREQVALGTDQVPWRNLAGFAELALARMVAQHQAASQANRTTFFDRGIPDVIGYMLVAGLSVPPAYYTAAATHPYASPVLLAPPWAEIYVNDAERWQTFGEAQALYHALRRTYQDLGFTVLDLPKVPVVERVAFVRKVVAT
ncbi:AAA family ATPase [Hymenobacter sp. GOD-10R]|uniref:AAA family ATPase n=1 Tax=Hymenobacter sp. GOD-10R TaxID=3093922 RepID=UPI002D79DB39|nr:AAA family ATPase [Hymenobacter sp. GOD-10R]WRQ28511.1 AAA family ATPase [Hymenobacter sp. GOD-10R]